jgi:hypothetical protein
MKSVFEFTDRRWKGKRILNVTVVSIHQISPALYFKNTVLCTRYQRDQINGSRHGSCSKRGEKRNAYEVLVRKLEGNNTTLKTQACMDWIILK